MPARVEPVMTPAAEHDEIFFAVRPQLASPNYVMDLELIAPAAVLTFPTVPLEDFHHQLAVVLEVEPKPRSFSKVATHADRRISRKNCCWGAAETCSIILQRTSSGHRESCIDNRTYMI